MVVSLWLAFYLLARGHGNQASVRIFLALLALGLYYYNSFASTIDPQAANEPVREFAVTLALVAWHQLTFSLLAPETQKKFTWLSYVPLLLGVIAAVALFSSPPGQPVDMNYIYPVQLSSTYMLVGGLQVLLAAANVYNVVLIARNQSWPQTKVFFTALGFGLLAIVYGLVGTLLQVPLPRFVATVTILITFLLLSYSVAKYQTLVDKRISLEDLPVSGVLIFSISAIYVFSLLSHGLSAKEIAFVSVLVVCSHSAYDLVHDFLDRLFHRRERAAFGEVRKLARNAGEGALHANLRRGLAILVGNLEASGGFIAIKAGDDFQVATSLRSLAADKLIPAQSVLTEELREGSAADLAEHATWLAPAYGGGSQVAVIGIGPRLGNKKYVDEDLFWLEEFADQVGALVFAQQAAGRRPGRAGKAKPAELDAGEMFDSLAYRPDTQTIEAVENGLRDLNDYVKLGASPLVSLLGAEGKTTIERGKNVQSQLESVITTLRPAGDQPKEPLPREWHNYTILHKAYVEEIPDREIMARLYISERTFYRARRRALHGVAKSILEMSANG